MEKTNKKPAAKAVETVEKIVETPKVQKDTWEVKDRLYYLTHDYAPLTYTLPSRHTRRFPLLWFDPKEGKQKEIRHASNQNSPFVEEQKGECTMEHIIFKDGTLFVPKEKQSLQKLLSIYHPQLNKRYEEKDDVKEAVDDLEYLEYEFQALALSRELDIDHAEAILRTEVGSEVNKMSSKELKRDLLVFAKNNPTLFLQLANDENIQLRNTAVKATEERIITLSQDQRTFSWASNGKKLMKVPFEENPYSAFAAFLKTDEGVEVFKSIEKKLK
jgi:hypothetical protein|tara:strand:+ start:19 stop:837 length:819 start_codon:yes stop_codon:yes gene_type:complete